MAEKTYKVLREHQGDRFYAPDDTRELEPSDAQHLVDLGVLEETGAKMAPAHKNKADKALQNKDA